MSASYTLRRTSQQPTSRPVRFLTVVIDRRDHDQLDAALADFRSTVAVARPGERIELIGRVER